MPSLVYFSNVSGNTHRFVSRLGMEAARIPIYPHEQQLIIDQPFVLVTPTYGGGNDGGAVPKQVARFLNDRETRSLLRGVISAGNTNFGSHYCAAGEIIAAKCCVPHLYRLEIFGTPDDVTAVRNGLDSFWTQH